MTATDRPAPAAAEAPPPGSMTLSEHLRELRSRLVKSLLAIVAGMVVGWIYYPEIFAWLSRPFEAVVDQARAEGRDVTLALTGVADPFVLQLQVAGLAGLIIASPVWLYQLWRFITPGLHRNERRWAIAFAAVATPLFLAGMALAYLVLPFGLQVLFGFTPDGVENIVSVDRYLSFFIRTVLVFGIGFLAPLVLVLLNFAGLVSGRRMVSWWRWIVFVIFVFAAIATPTGDPINLILLAAPMMLLVGLAIGTALLNDRRRRRKAVAGGEADYDQWDDDEASPTPVSEHDAADDVASPLADDVEVAPPSEPGPDAAGR